MTTWLYHLTVSTVRVGQSVKDAFKAWLIPQRLRGALRSKRHIRVNGKTVSTNYVLQAGDVLELTFETADFRNGESHYAPNAQATVPIIFENEDLVVVDKPAGMKMHPHSPHEDDTLLNYLAANFQDRQVMSAGQPARPYMVHRIDRDTSGAVIVAKNPVVVPILNQLLAQKAIKRTYLAWVQGAVLAPAGEVNTPIGIDPHDARRRVINGIAAQPARTYWALSHTVYQNSLLRVQLDTGRMHQIRVHLASIGHPIIGDPLYQPEKSATRMMLHAATITVPLPFDGGTTTISGAIPTDFPRQLKTI